MNIGGDDDDAIGLDGTEGQGTEGQDSGAGDERQEADLSAEHADDQADDGEQQVADGEAARPSRGEARIQRLANETKQLRDDLERERRERAEERRQQWQTQNTRSEQEERERLALMTPDERAEYRIQQMERRFEQRSAQDRISTQAAMDKAAYDAKATIDPVYRKFQGEVEERFQAQLRQGRPVEREIILKLLLGERALSGARSGGTARKQAQSRVASQRVAAASGKGDTAADRGKAGDTPEKRLQGQFI